MAQVKSMIVIMALTAVLGFGFTALALSDANQDQRPPAENVQ